MKTINKLWLGIGVLILLSPLGLILPEYFKAGSAWGEWGLFPDLWNALMPDYTFRGWEEKGLKLSCFSYIISAIIGVLVVACAALLIGKFLSKKK